VQIQSVVAQALQKNLEQTKQIELAQVSGEFVAGSEEGSSDDASNMLNDGLVETELDEGKDANQTSDPNSGKQPS